MNSNPFVPILLNRGFTRGVTGRFFDSDSKYNDGVSVEVSDTQATVVTSWGEMLTFPATPEGVQEFRGVLAV
jgi:hypothetical protein